MEWNDSRLNWKVWKNITPCPMTGCWLWVGTVRDDGYGKYHRTYAHRLVYTALVGPIPDDRELDHLCRVRCCVNPQHLEAVTRSINQLRSPITVGAVHRSKTHCPKGHAYEGDNLRYETNGKSKWRTCVICRRAKDEKRRRAKGMDVRGPSTSTEERKAYYREYNANRHLPREPKAPVTHCLAGHEFTTENTYVKKNGARTCKECRRTRKRRYYNERKSRA